MFFTGLKNINHVYWKLTVQFYYLQYLELRTKMSKKLLLVFVKVIIHFHNKKKTWWNLNLSFSRIKVTFNHYFKIKLHIIFTRVEFSFWFIIVNFYVQNKYSLNKMLDYIIIRIFLVYIMLLLYLHIFKSQNNKNEIKHSFISRN